MQVQAEIDSICSIGPAFMVINSAYVVP